MSILTSRVHDTGLVPAFRLKKEVVNCHHNYVAKEHHYGSEVFVTRKGAVRAGRGTWVSFQEAWGRAPISSGGKETVRASSRAVTVPGASCPATKPRSASL